MTFYLFILSSSINFNLFTQYLRIGAGVKTEKKNKDFVLRWAILPLSQGEGKTLRSSRREQCFQAGPWRPCQHLDLARSGSHSILTLPPPLSYHYSCLHTTIRSSPNYPGSQPLVLAPVWKQSLENAWLVSPCLQGLSLLLQGTFLDALTRHNVLFCMISKLSSCL